MKKLMYFIVSFALLIIITGCPDKDDNPDPVNPKTKVSEWSGTFTGNVENGTLGFILYSDNSITLNWETPNACCTSSTGSYTLNGTNFSYTVNGLATAAPESSNFSMTGNGSLNASSGNGSYSINFNGQGWENQSGSWNVSVPGSQNASLTVVLNLPADAEGKTGVVIIDTDLDADNGVISSLAGACPTGTLISVPFDDVPAGTYFIYGGVWVVGEYGDEPGPGDYIGVYGGTYPNNIPDQPNAIVPASGSKTFNIDLIVISKKSNISITSPEMNRYKILTSP